MGEVANGRTDLRHLPFVTIDPPDAKDFDDAVCLVNENGVQTLWVAIADVAHYVRAGTALDRAAAARATSVYLPHTVLPMLPPKLADDLCSLRAGVDRLAMVVAMELDEEETVVNTIAYEAVIHVNANIAYDDVLNTNEYDDMLALATTWQNREIRLNLNNPELRPRLHGDHELRVAVKWPNEATRMIESFMVATNTAVGHLLGPMDAPLPLAVPCTSRPSRSGRIERKDDGDGCTDSVADAEPESMGRARRKNSRACWAIGPVLDRVRSTFQDSKKLRNETMSPIIWRASSTPMPETEF